MLSFRCPLDVFDEIWDLIESVSNVFLPTFDFCAFSKLLFYKIQDHHLNILGSTYVPILRSRFQPAGFPSYSSNTVGLLVLDMKILKFLT